MTQYTLMDFIKEPQLIDTYKQVPFLIKTELTEEVIIAQEKDPEPQDATRPGYAPEPTAVFSHETMSMMKATKAERLESLAKLVSPKSDVFVVTKGEQNNWDYVTVGRSETADICILNDMTISSVHAQFEINQHDYPYIIKDTGSSNGTFLNRDQIQPYKEVQLKNGDCIRFGHTIFYFLTGTMFSQLVSNLKSS